MVYVPYTNGFIFERFILNSVNETLYFRGNQSRLRKKEAIKGEKLPADLLTDTDKWKPKVGTFLLTTISFGNPED